MASVTPPPVTDDHRHRAFNLLCFRGTTYELAMADEYRHRLIEACAASLRTMDWKQGVCQDRSFVRRVLLDECGNPIAWTTQVVRGEFQPVIQPDLLN